MITTKQHLQSITINKLKNLTDCTIDFNGKPLVAIMGVNGLGKSTVLHALACVYKPVPGSNGEDHKFSEFFLPNTFALWDDSDFSIRYTNEQINQLNQRATEKTVDDGTTVHEKTYRKRDRWTPRYATRPERYVTFLGIKTCVPDIEDVTSRSILRLTEIDNAGGNNAEVLDACRYVLSIPYESLTICESGSGRRYLCVKRNDIDGKTCTSLSMGAGEQRVFKILEALYHCDKYGLVLIDELELLLHENAVKRIVQTIADIARKRHLQVIFTTHSMLMSELSNYVDIRYLEHSGGETLVRTDIGSDSYYDLTGARIQRPITVYVEDKLSKTIITELCSDLSCQDKVSVYTFGSSQNSYTVIAGRVLDGQDINRTIAVLDGDVDTTDDAKRKQVDRVITGNEPGRDAQKQLILHAIKQYNLPAGEQPESYIRHCILHLNPDALDDRERRLYIALEKTVVVQDRHDFLNGALERLGYDESDKLVGLAAMIRLFAKTPEWAAFVKPVRKWLESISATADDEAAQ